MFALKEFYKPKSRMKECQMIFSDQCIIFTLYNFILQACIDVCGLGNLFWSDTVASSKVN